MLLLLCETNKKNGVLATRLEVWMAGYSKDNKPSTNKVAEVMTQMKELGAQSNATDEEIITQALGGGLAFLHTNPSALEEKISDENPASVLLAYINGDHEYILFDPYGEQQACEQGIARRQSLFGFQEIGQFGYASIYEELPEFNLKVGKQTLPAPFVASEKPWETIFSGSSHSLPPLTKLCSSFLKSLLEKRTATVE
ncbi:hypothetical protein ACSBR2_018268 [Camellia fascicularis]